MLMPKISAGALLAGACLAPGFAQSPQPATVPLVAPLFLPQTAPVQPSGAVVQPQPAVVAPPTVYQQPAVQQPAVQQPLQQPAVQQPSPAVRPAQAPAVQPSPIVQQQPQAPVLLPPQPRSVVAQPAAVPAPPAPVLQRPGVVQPQAPTVPRAALVQPAPAQPQAPTVPRAALVQPAPAQPQAGAVLQQPVQPAVLQPRAPVAQQPAAAQPQSNIFQPRVVQPRPVQSAPAVAQPAPVLTQPAPPHSVYVQPQLATAAHPGDDNFAMLREAARAGDGAKAESYAATLGQYPIASYVDYYRLKARLAITSHDEIRAFLARHQGSAIADRLRNDWLLELGRARDWANFDQQYPQFVLNDDYQVRCYGLMARIARGEKVADDARTHLVSPPSYGDACNALVAALVQAGQFDANDVLAQLRLAGEFGSTGPARRAAALLGASDTRAAQAVDLPALAMARGVGDTRAEREIYLVAISRMARSSLKLALVAFRKNLSSLTIEEKAIGYAALAHAASLKLDPEARQLWQDSYGAPLTHEQVQWKTRIALRHRDWRTVKSAIGEMPPALRAQGAWTYWLARALQAEPAPSAETPQAMYQRIADQGNFYGQLALEELGQLISIPAAPAPLSEAEVASMAANPALHRALKFFSMRMRVEGTREWNWEMRKLGERELIAAAEFARRNGILDRMVYSSERTRTQFDYTQRFPSPHNEILTPTTAQLGLDKAWVYGLIRQESRFIMDARSSAGASGLMQVMPATAQFVARKIGLGDYVRDKLNDLHTNLVLGSNYLNMVLANAGGSQPLATAAYNAGPGRMRTWRATLSETMEGAVFAESIPFLETRVYVKNVMSNATNYAALFERKPQSLKARLGQVTPRGDMAADFP